MENTVAVEGIEAVAPRADAAGLENNGININVGGQGLYFTLYVSSFNQINLMWFIHVIFDLLSILVHLILFANIMRYLWP